MPPIRKQGNPTSGRRTKKNTSQSPQNNSSKQKSQKRSNAGNASFNKNRGSMMDEFSRPSSAAVAYASGVSTMKPSIKSSNNQCTIKHKEFIGNVSGLGNTNFNQAFSLALNPGIPATFPWLSNIAQNWQSYRFRKMRFCYFTRTGSNTAGSVILCPDYDAADAAPSTEQIIDSYEDAKEDAPWKNICCDLSPSAMHLLGPKKFVRTGALAANQDIKTYDVGNFFIFTVDSAAAASWGKIWVEYEVDFFVPQLPPAGSLSASAASFITTTTGTQASPFLAATASGPIVMTSLLTTLTMTGLTIGTKYLWLLANGITSTGSYTFNTLVGITAVTNPILSATASAVGLTFTATAAIGSFNIVNSGNAAGNPYIGVLVPAPTSFAS